MQPKSQNTHDFKTSVVGLWSKAVKSGVVPSHNAPNYLFRAPARGIYGPVAVDGHQRTWFLH